MHFPARPDFMKMFAPLALGAMALLPVAAPASAQETRTAPAAADPASVTDAEISQFVTVVMKARPVEEDDSLSNEQRQMAMLKIITDAGFEPARFSAVAQAIQADAGLQQKLKTEFTQRLAAQG